MTDVLTELKVAAAANLGNYRTTKNHTYLCRAINQTRLALGFVINNERNSGAAEGGPAGMEG